jgi:hypothetical protein
MLTTLLLVFSPLAQADVYRCTDAEGSIIFQQTPCAEPEPEPEQEKAEEAAPTAEIERIVDEPVARTEPRQEKSPELVAQCKKKYRDAIDVIDAEMRERYTPEQADDYKQRLRVLTEQLRDC